MYISIDQRLAPCHVNQVTNGCKTGYKWNTLYMQLVENSLAMNYVGVKTRPSLSSIKSKAMHCKAKQGYVRTTCTYMNFLLGLNNGLYFYPISLALLSIC